MTGVLVLAMVMGMVYGHGSCLGIMVVFKVMVLGPGYGYYYRNGCS